MTHGKNIFIYITSVILAIVFILYTAVIIGYQKDFFAESFFISDDGSITFLGKSYIIDERLTDAVQSYLLMCESAAEKLFPDFIVSPLKETAASLTEAAICATDSFVFIIYELTHGNM